MKLSDQYDKNKTKYYHLKEQNLYTGTEIGGNSISPLLPTGPLPTSTDARHLDFVVTRDKDYASTQIARFTTKFTTKVTRGFESYLLKFDEDVSGKSGDAAYIVKDVSTAMKDGSPAPKYVLKIFTRRDKEKAETNYNEIQYQRKFCEIFKNYKPCPQIYYYGVLTNQYPFVKNASNPQTFGIPSNEFSWDGAIYMIMEHYKGITLDKYIANICQKKENNEYTGVDPYNVIMQLFYLISKMQMEANLTHCDLHGKNIFIVKENNNVEYDFNHIGIQDDKYLLSEYVVKLLDFGEASGKINQTIHDTDATNLTPCNKGRRTTKSLEDLKFICHKSYKDRVDGISTVVMGEIGRQQGNVDINFMANIIKIMQYALKNDQTRVNDINTEDILKEAVASDYETNFKTRLQNIYNILSFNVKQKIKSVDSIENIDDKITTKNAELKSLQDQQNTITTNIKILNSEIQGLKKKRNVISKAL